MDGSGELRKAVERTRPRAAIHSCTPSLRGGRHAGSRYLSFNETYLYMEALREVFGSKSTSGEDALCILCLKRTEAMALAMIDMIESGARLSLSRAIDYWSQRRSCCPSAPNRPDPTTPSPRRGGPAALDPPAGARQPSQPLVAHSGANPSANAQHRVCC